MYCDYFGLRELPFTITPDPSYLYMSERHQEALAHLLFGVKDQDGFVQLTGEVGTGKTTLIRTLMAQLPDGIDLALIFNPKLSVFEFVASICDELHIKYPAETDSVKVLVDMLNAYLLNAYSQGRRVILVVDEAQNLHIDVLEQIRLLTNLETAKHKLLQIVLVGQPELREVLGQANLRQLAQRVTARYHLEPMTLRETQGYIFHRLKVAGARRDLFTRDAIRQIKKFSGGIPRLINVMCDRSLLGAYAREESQVTGTIVKKAAAEVYGELNSQQRSRAKLWLSLVAISVLIMVGVIWQSGITWRPWISPVTANHHDVITELLPETVASTEASVDIKSIESESELERVLQISHDSKNLDMAFSGLFASWRLDYDKTVGTTGCERAISLRLQCYWGIGTWDEYLILNRPAIIWVDTAAAFGEKQYIVIRSLREGEGVVEIAGNLYKISEPVLRQVWSDRYLLLWQPPVLGSHLISLGDRSDVVLWLRRNIEQFMGRNLISRRIDVFDKSLEGYVKVFQRKHGLVDDGVVGIKTMIVINSLSGEESIPILDFKGGESSE